MMKISYKWASLFFALALINGAACRQAANEQPTTPVKPEMAQKANNPAASEDVSADVPPPPPTTFRAGIVVPVGTIGYRVESAQFVEKLEDGAKPAAGRQFLLVKIAARNTGPKESPVAAFKIIQGNNEYLPSNQAAKVNGSLNSLTQLTKDELKSGVLVFETPATKNLKLQLNSAPPLKDQMFIELADAFGKK